MKFKDITREERHKVFLNLGEFAEMIELDGRKFKAVVERNDITLRDTTDDRSSVVYDSMTIFCNKEDLASGKYFPEKRVAFNGEYWFVYTCDNEDLVTMTLYKERS